MGYTHSWSRPEKISKKKMRAITSDFKKALPEIEKHVKLAGGDGHGLPLIEDDNIIFNGRRWRLAAKLIIMSQIYTLKQQTKAGDY